MRGFNERAGGGGGGGGATLFGLFIFIMTY
jgi:hypothetical protein